jgi:hypothetical protein
MLTLTDHGKIDVREMCSLLAATTSHVCRDQAGLSSLRTYREIPNTSVDLRSPRRLELGISPQKRLDPCQSLADEPDQRSYDIDRGASIERLPR